mmetsp:Transcript_167380/g.296366  ORF Transcript_167380/g.296366 Transcript_167380/m.296366 type:complete len:570 (+) Transcript_167380:83-1792(+)
MGCTHGSSSTSTVTEQVAVVEGILISPKEANKSAWEEVSADPEEFKTLLEAFNYCDPAGAGVLSSASCFKKAMQLLATTEGLDVEEQDLYDLLKKRNWRTSLEELNFPQFVAWARSKDIRLPMGLQDSSLKRSVSTMSTCFPLPPTWTGPKNNPSWNERMLVSDDVLLAELQEFLDLSYRKIFTRDRKKTGSNKVPSAFVLERVLRSENYKAWAAYYMKRRHIKSASTGEGFVQFEARTGKATEFCNRHQLDDHCNEWLLFHGTNQKAAESICETGFTTKTAGSATGTLYGKGIYFAESITKADEYAREDAQGVCCALVCRVVGGRVLYNHDAVPNAKRLQSAVLSGAYDSVLGDRENSKKKTFREFVMFDHDQVYVEYVIFYRRVYADSPEAPSDACLLSPAPRDTPFASPPASPPDTARGDDVDDDDDDIDEGFQVALRVPSTGVASVYKKPFHSQMAQRGENPARGDHSRTAFDRTYTPSDSHAGSKADSTGWADASVKELSSTRSADPIAATEKCEGPSSPVASTSASADGHASGSLSGFSSTDSCSETPVIPSSRTQDSLETFV